jgi:two-component system, OmpR family, sensor histidine kinase MprB
VTNLVDNAVKWSPAGGTVRVRLARADDRWAVLTVADSGPGVDPGERDRIFDGFYRPPDARDTPGSGVGLAIVKEMVEDVGGRIAVDESGDGGALFTVEVPGSPG